jgi:hypothetical protein
MEGGIPLLTCILPRRAAPPPSPNPATEWGFHAAAGVGLQRRQMGKVPESHSSPASAAPHLRNLRYMNCRVKKPPHATSHATPAAAAAAAASAPPPAPPPAAAAARRACTERRTSQLRLLLMLT